MQHLCNHRLTTEQAVEQCLASVCMRSIFAITVWSQTQRLTDDIVSVCMCSVFAIKPFTGLLSTQHQIFVVRIIPEKVQTYKHNLTMRLNDNEKFDKVRWQPRGNLSLKTLDVTVRRRFVTCGGSWEDVLTVAKRPSLLLLLLCSLLLLWGRRCYCAHFSSFWNSERNCDEC